MRNQSTHLQAGTFLVLNGTEKPNTTVSNQVFWFMVPSIESMKMMCIKAAGGILVILTGR